VGPKAGKHAVNNGISGSARTRALNSSVVQAIACLTAENLVTKSDMTKKLQAQRGAWPTIMRSNPAQSVKRSALPT
jgi:hypothetical protein